MEVNVLSAEEKAGFQAVDQSDMKATMRYSQELVEPIVNFELETNRRHSKGVPGDIGGKP